MVRQLFWTNSYSILIYPNWLFIGTVNRPHNQAIWVHFQYSVRIKIRSGELASFTSSLHWHAHHDSVSFSKRLWLGMPVISSLLSLLSLGYWFPCNLPSFRQSMHQFRSVVVNIDLVGWTLCIECLYSRNILASLPYKRWNGDLSVDSCGDMQTTTEEDTRPNQSGKHPHS